MNSIIERYYEVIYTMQKIFEIPKYHVYNIISKDGKEWRSTSLY